MNKYYWLLVSMNPMITDNDKVFGLFQRFPGLWDKKELVEKAKNNRSVDCGKIFGQNNEQKEIFIYLKFNSKVSN